MNKHTIDKDVYENYIDATVALFMEYYSVASLPHDIQSEFDVKKCEEISFPSDLDDRCRSLIKKELARYRRKQHLKNLAKTLKYTAACFIALLSLSSFLFVTVEAFRIPIINYYIEQNNGHWEISSDTPTTPYIDDTLDLKDPLVNLLPNDYQLIVQDGDSFGEMNAIYENSDGKRFCFSSVSGDNWIAIDSENAEISQQHQLCGFDAITVVKDGVVSLTWIDTDLNVVFTMLADDMTESEVSTIGEHLIALIRK